MRKNQPLTVVELKSLLLARFNAEQGKMAGLQVRLQQELGNVAQTMEPELIAFNNKLAEQIYDLIARRLKRNRRTTPLISSRDFVRLVPFMIDEITKIEDGELGAEDRKKFEKYVKAVSENALEMVYAMVPPRKNLYEEYWRWVTTVLDLAAERGILPTELLALENAIDDITRRMFTKKQFVALSSRLVNKFWDADVFKKSIIQPMLECLVPGADEEERREQEQELETELMPQLRKIVEKTRVVIKAWIGEEAKRIYAAA